MSDGKVRRVSATEFQRGVGAVIDAVRSGKQVVIVTAHGRAQIVIVPVEEYEALCRERRLLKWEQAARLNATESETAANDGLARGEAHGDP